MSDDVRWRSARRVALVSKAARSLRAPLRNGRCAARGCAAQLHAHLCRRARVCGRRVRTRCRGNACTVLTALSIILSAFATGANDIGACCAALQCGWRSDAPPPKQPTRLRRAVRRARSPSAARGLSPSSPSSRARCCWAATSPRPSRVRGAAHRSAAVLGTRATRHAVQRSTQRPRRATVTVKIRPRRAALPRCAPAQRAAPMSRPRDTARGLRSAFRAYDARPRLTRPRCVTVRQHYRPEGV